MYNQPTSNVTKISHLSNMCTNVTKVSHFDYTCVINIGWPHSKKKLAYRPPSLSSFISFSLLVHSQRFKKLWMCYLKLHKKKFKCQNKEKIRKSLK
jgi:hypothetical protein